MCCAHDSPSASWKRSVSYHPLWVFLTVLTLCATAEQSPAQPQQYAVTRLSDLQLGTVVAGTEIEVLHTDPGAAKFHVERIRGSKNTYLEVSLPAELTSEQGDVISVTFGATSAAWADEDGPAGRTPFDPAQGTFLEIPNDKDIYVWIGASIAPSQATPGATYVGTLTLLAANN